MKQQGPTGKPSQREKIASNDTVPSSSSSATGSAGGSPASLGNLEHDVKSAKVKDTVKDMDSTYDKYVAFSLSLMLRFQCKF